MISIDVQIQQLNQLNKIISNRKIINKTLVEEFVALGYAKSNNGFSSLTKAGEEALKTLINLKSNKGQ